MNLLSSTSIGVNIATRPVAAIFVVYLPLWVMYTRNSSSCRYIWVMIVSMSRR
ncbi:hypothetical protein P153DRAFT_364802 [Dothidotthia symphoricarpi CBS 119687]|uniref:Uncharacterized protein n=1 Tax=Dothidotthia symphoricarpi CBS 119687 TaxID=1392245 RepID=A0A6A6AKQ5_9PLEO|nr:uncharacterized protein P153DRAFT_364802 [Dothidotthia symphoricarpi CBS 119687]KAF2132400.1 hypothetical protein P153DRAFT_364802 [Dothidotthia symphoricarpi CBS 119687]